VDIARYSMRDGTQPDEDTASNEIICLFDHPSGSSQKLR
jgi:hypothetical protein